MKVAVAGATGYTGLELVRILLKHPQVKLSALTSESFAGKHYTSVYPSLHSFLDITLESLNPIKISQKADFIFTALPHKEAMAVVPLLLENNKKVVDLSADFRFKNQNTYKKWYQKHTAPKLLSKAVYGLPEINRKKIRSASLVANPGCYPTSIILPLVPLLQDNLIEPDTIIADAKSGVTGAGRSLKTTSLFSEVSEGFKPYGIMQHRHQPEIEEQLSHITQQTVSITFAPHLVPMNRGILSTIYVNLKRSIKNATLYSLFTKFYKDDFFVRIMPEGVLPNSGSVRGSNYCDIGFCQNGKRIVLFAAIDNLIKGASGQAVQNMNLMMGFKENTALDFTPLYP